MAYVKFFRPNENRHTTASRREAKDTGVVGEQMAARWLVDQGYTIVDKNYRYGHHEIDLVAMEGGDLVIVEVKTRTNTTFGLPETAVDHRKRAILIDLANRYVRHHRWQGNTRFDVLAITLHDGQQEFKLIKNAFTILSY